MSHGKFRTNKECENCGYTVELDFCTKCGQKNVETRQSFPSLLGHFAEDLTHYDSAFWKSLKDLLFRPGRLTRIYLEGKRQEYVPPVKLYIFVSFITFLLLGILPDPPVEKKFHKDNAHKETTAVTVDTINNSVTTVHTEAKKAKEENEINVFNKVYHNQKEVDAGYKKGELGYLGYHFVTAMIKAKDSSDEAIGEAMLHAVPKAIFLYMPLFTFWIWLFHGKRRWYFFDHAIFTLHYFSFLLLLTTISHLITWSLGYLLSAEAIDSVSNWLSLVLLCYSFFYFFRSHRRMYGENRAISRIKSLCLFIINMICISFASALLMYYAFMNLH
jgi:hypothetical protein